MWRVRLIPDETNIRFLRLRKALFVLSIVLGIASVALLFGRGLNFGIDFEGGILIEIGLEKAPDLGEMRDTVGNLGLGEVALQTFGADNDILIRVERQPGDADAQQAAVTAVRGALQTMLGDDVSYRRVEFVGPKVGAELIQAGIIAVVLSVALMLIYIWFRFELPFAIGAVIALVHDVVLTLGMFSLLGLEFNLAIVAAILLIVGYSMNDTVVVYDRVRENLRKYKTLSLIDLLDRSVNDTLSRTVITSLTTLLALLALFIFGGEVIRDFSFAMIWGVIVGTYSSVFIAGAMLLTVQPQRGSKKVEAGIGTAERTQELQSEEDFDPSLVVEAEAPLPELEAPDAEEAEEAEAEPTGPQSRARRRASSSRARRKRRRGSKPRKS